MDKILELILELEQEIHNTYGICNAITQLSLEPEVFDMFVIEMYKTSRNMSTFRPSDMSNLDIYGINFKARRRESL